MPEHITSSNTSVAGSDQLSLAKRDGCGCPSYVLFCVHFTEQRLILENATETQLGHTCRGGGVPFDDRAEYQLHLTVDEWVSCDRTSDCPAVVSPYPCCLCLGFDGLPSAEAAFDEQAELLRASDA